MTRLVTDLKICLFFPQWSHACPQATLGRIRRETSSLTSMGIAFHPAGEYRNFPMLLFLGGIKSNFKTSSSQKSTYTKLVEVCPLQLTSYFELVSEGRVEQRVFCPNMLKKINTDHITFFQLWNFPGVPRRQCCSSSRWCRRSRTTCLRWRERTCGCRATLKSALPTRPQQISEVNLCKVSSYCSRAARWKKIQGARKCSRISQI